MKEISEYNPNCFGMPKLSMIDANFRREEIHMKKLLCILLVVCLIFVMVGCGKTKTLHCDSCGKEVHVKEKSNMEEDWIIYCEECNEEIFSDDPIISEE